jgi:hypothetical protein
MEERRERGKGMKGINERKKLGKDEDTKEIITVEFLRGFFH